MKVCLVEGCNKPMLARGWCAKHWSRWKRNGDPLGGGTPKDGTVAKFFYEVVVPFKGDECLIWPFGRDGYGYGKIHLDGGSRLVHRRACEEVHGPPPDLPDVQAAHNCGNGHNGCCNPTHLRWATRTGNEADKIVHGTSNRGSNHGMSVLNEEQVIAIRAMQGKASRDELAAMYGVTARTIGDIHRRKSWAWLVAANDNEPARAAA